MGGMDGWDVALLAVAAYVAVTVLVRMMLSRHKRLVDQLARRAEQERKRKRRAQQRQDARRAG